MFRVSKPTGMYLRAVLKMGSPGQNDAWHRRLLIFSTNAAFARLPPHTLRRCRNSA